jgi:hypothetical protein
LGVVEPGVYLLPDRKVADFFDISQDRVWPQAALCLYGSVMETPHVPESLGGYEVSVRPDGKQVLVGWGLDPEWEIPLSVLAGLKDVRHSRFGNAARTVSGERCAFGIESIRCGPQGSPADRAI